MSTAAIKAGVAEVLRAVPGVGQVAEARTGLPAWLMRDHPRSAYCLVTREPNAAGEEVAVGVGPIVFTFTNVRVELWLRQDLTDSQPVWDALVDEVAAALRTNKTLGGQANLDCWEPQPLVDDEQLLTDGAAEVWLHHAIYLLRVREVIRYTPV